MSVLNSMKRLVNQFKPREIITEEEFNDHFNQLGLGKDNSMESDELETDQLNSIRKAIIAKREVQFKKTLGELEKRKGYEDGIRRAYFHVKPLEPSQVSNWRNYTDFEIQENAHDRIVFLFERCMVACALYDEFWLKVLNFHFFFNSKYLFCFF